MKFINIEIYIIHVMLIWMTLLFVQCKGSQINLPEDKKKESININVYPSADLTVHADELIYPEGISHVVVEDNNKGHQFLHDATLIAHGDELIAGWDSRPDIDSFTEASFRVKRSKDGGKTWSEFETAASYSLARGTYFASMQFLSYNSTLYAIASKLIGKGVRGCTIFKYNEADKLWTELSDISGPFMPNNAPIKMKDGNWIMGGRAVSGYSTLPYWPLFPAVAISQGDEFTKPWKIVLLQNHEFESDQIPETTLIIDGESLLAFTRRNGPGFMPYLYQSDNYGRSWQKIASHDFRSTSSKIYAGNLNDGRGYVTFNYPVHEQIGQGLIARSVLAIAISENGEKPFSFSKIFKIQAPGTDKPLISHYPTALEYHDKLYIIYTAHFTSDEHRQCEVAVIPLNSFK